MKVRVKKGQKGFFNSRLMREGDEFHLHPVKHSTATDAKGNPVIITPEQQFSDAWMEMVEEAEKKPGRKPKAEGDISE